MSQLHFKQMHVEAYCKNRFFSEAITPRKTLENSDIGYNYGVLMPQTVLN